MKIRPAAPSDAAAIARVHVDTWRSTYAGIMSDEFLAGLSNEKRGEMWLENLSETNSTKVILVSEDDSGQVVGFASGGPVKPDEKEFDCELYGIYILKEFQRQGIGSRLMAEIAKGLLERGYHSMMLWAIAANESIGFYESLGGTKVRKKMLNTANTQIPGVAYGWPDIQILCRQV